MTDAGCLVVIRRSEWGLSAGHLEFRSDAGDVQPYPIDPRLGGDVEGYAVIIAPGHVVRVFRPLDHAQRLALR